MLSHEDNLVLENQELKDLVKSLFDDYLDYTEESESGKLFHPITITSCRVLKTGELNKLLARMKEIVNK